MPPYGYRRFLSCFACWTSLSAHAETITVTIVKLAFSSDGDQRQGRRHHRMGQQGRVRAHRHRRQAWEVMIRSKKSGANIQEMREHRLFLPLHPNMKGRVVVAPLKWRGPLHEETNSVRTDAML